MALILFGQSGSKRQIYFAKACQAAGIPLRFFDIEAEWEQGLAALQPGDRLKIDPPRWTDSRIAALTPLIKNYYQKLKELSRRGKEQGLSFLNTPAAIGDMLDKRLCKRRLLSAGIAVTPLLEFSGGGFAALISYLRERRIFQVFIKSNFGSGAAGVLALKLHPQRAGYTAQTAMLEENGEYFNTKKLRTITDTAVIQKIADFLLAGDVLVEQWVPKAAQNGVVYDLRVMYQFGRVDFIQPRGARGGAITNLHLNNLPLSLADVALPAGIKEEIANLCGRACALFLGLRSAGFDILLTKDGKLMIIEINAQGDLLYQDIYAENRIYRRQVQELEAWKG